MNLLDRLVQDKKISNEELSKLSAVRQGLLEALEGGQMTTAKFIQKTFSDCDADELSELNEMVDKLAMAQAEKAVLEYGVDEYLTANELMDAVFIIRNDQEASKEAAAGRSPLTSIMRMLNKKAPLTGKTLGNAATAAIMATLGMSLIHSAGQGIGMVSSPIKDMLAKNKAKHESERILSEILDENPELKKDSKIVEHFGVLQRYAPQTAAMNKPIAEALLKKMNQWGQIDPATMKQLIETEGSHLENIGVKGRGKGEGFKPLQAGDLAAIAMGSNG